MVEAVGAEGPNSSVEVKQKDGQFDTSYLDNVTSHVQMIYTFNHTITRNKVSSKSLGGEPHPTQYHNGHYISMAYFWMYCLLVFPLSLS